MTIDQELLERGDFAEQADVVAAFLELEGWLTYAEIVRRQAARITRLEAQVAELTKEADDHAESASRWRSTACDFEARLEEAEEVIAPFAVWDEDELEGAPDDMCVEEALYAGSQPTVGDLRRARAFLEKIKSEPGACEGEG